MTQQLTDHSRAHSHDDMLRLDGKGAVVTGGHRRPGRSTVRGIAQAGASAVFTDRGEVALW